MLFMPHNINMLFEPVWGNLITSEWYTESSSEGECSLPPYIFFYNPSKVHLEYL